MSTNPLVNIFRTQELRQRILFTLFMLVILRLGVAIPVPGVDFGKLRTLIDSATSQQEGANILDYLDLFVGGAFRHFSVFMLGIMPYITSSIIVQLLTIAIPKLKKMQEEESGRKKMRRYMRYATVLVCLVQSYFLISSTIDPRIIHSSLGYTEFIIIAIITVTAGTLFIMWMGEQITQRGIGNGISLIIFAGIVSRIPNALNQLGLFRWLIRSLVDLGVLLGIIPRSGFAGTLYSRTAQDLSPIFILMAIIIFVVVVLLIIYEQQGQRKIPVFYAKRIIGRRVYGSQNTYIPFKLNPSSVIPVIFASTLLITPIQLFKSWGAAVPFFNDLAMVLRPHGPTYLILYALLIIAFAYFYTNVTLNPLDLAKNIREHGGSIPGIRSERMEEHLSRILYRILLPGALFLAFIAIIPDIVSNIFHFPSAVADIMGGTSLIIVVGVGLDTMSQIEGMLRMHHHEGLVKRGKIQSRNI